MVLTPQSSPGALIYALQMPLRRETAGEESRMSSFIKYTRRTFKDLIPRGGFRMEHLETSEDGRFLLAAAAPEPV